MSARKQPPPGLIGYMLDDEDRTRRARTLLWPVAVILLSFAIVVVHSPVVVGTFVSATACCAWIRKRRNAGSPPPQLVADGK